MPCPRRITLALSYVNPQAHRLMSEAWDSIEKEVKG